MKFYFLICFVLIFANNIFSQTEDQSENVEHFPLAIGFDIGLPIRLGNTYFTRSISVFIGFYINKEKTVTFNIKGGSLKLSSGLEQENMQAAGSLIGFELSYRIVKFQKSRITGTFGGGLVITKKHFFGGPLGSITYLYNLSHVVNLSGSIGFPIIAASRFEGYHHNPFISFGIMLLAP